MIKYHTTTDIWLDLEDYYNKGLTPKRAIELIEGINEPIADDYAPLISSRLRCEKEALWDDLIVKSSAISSEEIQRIVDLIENAIDIEMFGKPIMTPSHN